MTPKPVIDPGAIVEAVCAHRGISRAEVVGLGKSPALIWPRFEAAYLVRAILGLSYQAVGAVLGGRDASTIMSAMTRMAQRLEADASYRADVEALRWSICPPPSHPGGIDAGLRLLAVRSVLLNADLTDGEARMAALQLIAREA